MNAVDTAVNGTVQETTLSCERSLSSSGNRTYVVEMKDPHNVQHWLC